MGFESSRNGFGNFQEDARHCLPVVVDCGVAKLPPICAPHGIGYRLCFALDVDCLLGIPAAERLLADRRYACRDCYAGKIDTMVEHTVIYCDSVFSYVVYYGIGGHCSFVSM